LTFLFPKCPHHKLYLKKIQKRKNQKKKKKIAGVAGHPVWPRGGSATPINFFFLSFFGFFFKNKIYDEGILRIKRPKGLNCYNLKV
jgi:hypothetical protein